jgi:hypothetical protein
LWSEKKEKSLAMKAEGDKFYEAMRSYKVYEKLKKEWDFQERNDRIQQQKMERQAKKEQEEKQRELTAVPQHPCAAEIAICADLEIYLKRLLPKEEIKDTHVFVPVATKDDKGKMLKPIGKSVSDEGFFSAPALKSKKTKKAETSGSEALVHDLNTFGAFSKIKVKLPVTLSDVPACLEQVEKARAAFEARTEAEAEAEEKQPRARAQGAAEVFPVKVVVTATASDRVDVKVSIKA